MNVRILSCAASGVALALACAPIQRDLHQATVEAVKSRPRAVTILDVDVVDARPPVALEELKPTIRYIVPLVLLNFWGSAGHLRPEASLISMQPTAELDQIVTAALDNANLMAAHPADAQARLTLRVTLTELYGLTYQSGSNFVGLGGAAISQRSFAPYGFAAARIELMDEDGLVMASRYVTGFSDPDHSDLTIAAGQPSESLTDRLTWAGVQAAGDLTANIVRAVEPILADWPSPTTTTLAPAFYIARPTPDGQYMELGLIDINTGQVIDSWVKRRWMEPFSSIEEWVVDPYQGGDRMLSRDEYQQLVAKLEDRFDVRYVTNVRVAHFFGRRAAEKSTTAIEDGGDRRLLRASKGR